MENPRARLQAVPAASLGEPSSLAPQEKRTKPELRRSWLSFSSTVRCGQGQALLVSTCCQRCLLLSPVRCLRTTGPDPSAQPRRAGCAGSSIGYSSHRGPWGWIYLKPLRHQILILWLLLGLTPHSPAALGIKEMGCRRVVVQSSSARWTGQACDAAVKWLKITFHQLLK